LKIPDGWIEQDRVERMVERSPIKQPKTHHHHHHPSSSSTFTPPRYQSSSHQTNYQSSNSSSSQSDQPHQLYPTNNKNRNKIGGRREVRELLERYDWLNREMAEFGRILHNVLQDQDEDENEGEIEVS